LGYGAYKLIGMFTGEHTDGRGRLLQGSLQAISTNPFGYGVGSYDALIGYYPHNFFLEVMLSFGVFVCLIYIVVLVLAIYELYKAKEIKTWFFSLLYLYYLAIWMSSFDYLSSFQIHFALGGFVSCVCYQYKNYKESHI
jgi:O-antigen ligase